MNKIKTIMLTAPSKDLAEGYLSACFVQGKINQDEHTKLNKILREEWR